jgi:hypothetical protein
VPIEDTSLGRAAQTFADHLNGLLARTITQSRLVRVTVPATGRVLISFRHDGQPVAAPLKTREGTVFLAISQHCESRPTVDGAHRPVTAEYRYALATAPDAEPVLRWEYVRHRDPAGDGSEPQWCRHHIQGTTSIDFGTGTRSLNEFHVPTGFVLIEEVIRFLIVDLGAKPLSEDWARHLDESYDKFKMEFAPPPAERGT